MEKTKLLSNSEERKLKRLYKRNVRMSKPLEMWGILIILALLLGFWIAGTYSFFPEGAYRTFMENNVWVGFAVFFVICAGYFPLYIFIKEDIENM